MQTITFGSGEVATYTYDNRDRPTRILDKIGSTKNLDLNYTYDGTGNVLTLNTETYGYDWLDRLTSSSGPWTAITYTYDQVGNRVKMVQGSTTNYAYGPFNRLSSAGSTTYTYDANGNMLTKNDGTSWTFTYDYDNRLTKVVHSGTTVLQNAYDGDGNRIKKTESDTFVYAYQGLNLLYEKDLNTGVVTKRIYANGLQVAKMVGSTTTYLHEDHLGSIRFVSSSTGSQVFSSNYIPYGPQYGASGTPDEFLYAGKIYDGSTGLYYFGARYYDPTIGRFVTQDSYPGVKVDPQSLNRYIYARDNPMKFIDPTGHAAGHILYTDYGGSPDDVITTTTSFVNGVFTVTTVEQYKGYTTILSSTFQTVLSTSGSVTTSGSTVVLNVAPSGAYSVSTSTYSSAPKGNQAGAWAVTGLAILGTGLVWYRTIRGGFGIMNAQTAATGAPPGALGLKGTFSGLTLVKGDLAMIQYDWNEGPNANPEGAVNAFERGTGADILANDISSGIRWLLSWFG